MSEITITKENFESEVLRSEKPVLVDFWATWCGPCRMIAPVLSEIARERSDVKVGKINVDEQPDLANEFRIASIPTLLLFRGGQVVNQMVGVRPKATIEAMLGGNG